MAKETTEQQEGQRLAGQQVNTGKGYTIPFIEYTIPYAGEEDERLTGLEGDQWVEITPIDSGSARVRVYDIADIQAALSGMVVKAPITIDRVELPAVLTAITAVYNVTEAAGSDTHPAANMTLYLAAGGSGSLNPRASATASASVIPDIQVEIEERYCVNVPGYECTLYAPTGSTVAEILAALTTAMGANVEAWPQFRPVAHTITAKGQQVSLTAKADSSLGVSDTSYSKESGQALSREAGSSIKTVNIPPTIHDTITIATTSATATASVSADASIPTTTVSGPIASGTSGDAVATASVTPTSLSATTPASIPATGLRMYRLTAGPMEFGMGTFQAIIVDMAVLV